MELSSPRPFDSLSNIADFCHLLSEEPYVNGVVAAAYKSCKICDVQVFAFKNWEEYITYCYMPFHAYYLFP